MTRWLIRGLVVAGLVLGLGTAVNVGTAAAGMASIVTVAPVASENQADVEAAATSALRRAVRGAQAMGLDEMMLKSVRLVPGTGVVVEIVASESGDRPNGDAGEGPTDQGEDVERSSLPQPGKTRL
jgi:hypothetical protein